MIGDDPAINLYGTKRLQTFAQAIRLSEISNRAHYSIQSTCYYTLDT